MQISFLDLIAFTLYQEAKIKNFANNNSLTSDNILSELQATLPEIISTIDKLGISDNEAKLRIEKDFDEDSLDKVLFAIFVDLSSLTNFKAIAAKVAHDCKTGKLNKRTRKILFRTNIDVWLGYGNYDEGLVHIFRDTDKIKDFDKHKTHFMSLKDALVNKHSLKILSVNSVASDLTMTVCAIVLELHSLFEKNSFQFNQNQPYRIYDDPHYQLQSKGIPNLFISVDAYEGKIYTAYITTGENK
ncbi:MAG: hypothetical protein MJZ34_13945 [Paludibacteraceae bacterium]|nr:hypothetical protein [Paludibacteraceae bacterium]